ncbi:MAG: DNA polymerase/3'-5' exonuclease PolX [Candidatus Woykebacteria bacterium]
MEPNFTNKSVSEILRNVSAAYQVKGANPFQIRAYDLAADSIEHATSELKDLWESGNLDQIPGIGENLQKYLDELFKTGKVKHFEKILQSVPEEMFQFMKIPGVGPKTAFKLAEAGVISIEDLESRIKTGWLVKKGFSEKILQNILRGIEEFKRKSDRILLPVAGEIAKQVVEYLKQNSEVKSADTLGSLRRRVSTVGDIDIAVASSNPETVINHLTKFPGISRVVEAGDRTATIALASGIRVDLMVQPIEHYGSLLHHFTGSKSHNIHMRSVARSKGYSISEYGIKELKSGEMLKCETEDKVYSLFYMQTPPPELREDSGEIEAAVKHQLPDLIEIDDVKGDLQSHSTWSDGQNSIRDVAKAAEKLGREYIALTDHSYPSTNFKARLRDIEQYNYSNKGIRVISGLEVNINADYTLQVPDEILAEHEVILVSIHTSFRQPVGEMTRRIIKALENPNVDIFAHPTGRLLLEREGIDADWEKIFKVAAKLGKFLEINAFPNRLDLPDILIREAKRFGVRFSIGTDSHQVGQLSLMEYGVANARRGWVESKDVINTLPYKKIKDILDIK